MCKDQALELRNHVSFSLRNNAELCNLFELTKIREYLVGCIGFLTLQKKFLFSIKFNSMTALGRRKFYETKAVVVTSL